MNNKVLCPVSSRSGERYRLTVRKDYALVQVHRQNKWIDFSAMGVALKLLSDEALRLYLYLVKCPLDYPWALYKSVMEKRHSCPASVMRLPWPNSWRRST